MAWASLRKYDTVLQVQSRDRDQGRSSQESSNEFVKDRVVVVLAVHKVGNINLRAFYSDHYSIEFLVRYGVHTAELVVYDAESLIQIACLMK